MKKILLLAAMALTMWLGANAAEMNTFETESFTISYPADWDVSFYGDTWVNIENEDGDIRFNVSFNEEGPKLSQLKEAAENWVYMKERNGEKVDQKLIKDDYALVRSIITDEDDGTQTVEVWFLMITKEPEGFSGSIESPFEKANEAMDTLVEILATLNRK